MIILGWSILNIIKNKIGLPVQSTLKNGFYHVHEIKIIGSLLTFFGFIPPCVWWHLWSYLCAYS